MSEIMNVSVRALIKKVVCCLDDISLEAIVFMACMLVMLAICLLLFAWSLGYIPITQ